MNSLKKVVFGLLLLGSLLLLNSNFVDSAAPIVAQIDTPLPTYTETIAVNGQIEPNVPYALVQLIGAFGEVQREERIDLAALRWQPLLSVLSTSRFRPIPQPLKKTVTTIMN